MLHPLRGLAAVAVAAQIACTSVPRVDAPRISPEALLVDSVILSREDGEGPPPADVLAVNPPMDAFLARHVDRRASADLRLRQLTDAIMDPRSFGIVYDNVTRTAAETFRTRRGNCLSFSMLFVTLARRAGLEVRFQEVDLPPDWSLSKETFVLNQHMNVYVDLGVHGKRVVDFNIADFRSTYTMRRISDGRALAHYYNNIGVERMHAGDLDGALVWFRKAITSGDRRYAPAWTNLGTLYIRQNRRAYAEAAYLEALRAEPLDLVTLSNLVRLYEMNGESGRAAAYRRRVAYHRSRNPYYRYELARQAYSLKHYDDAITHLKHALRSGRKDDRFFDLMARAYLEKGDRKTAGHWLAQRGEIDSASPLKKIEK